MYSGGNNKMIRKIYLFINKFVFFFFLLYRKRKGGRSVF